MRRFSRQFNKHQVFGTRSYPQLIAAAMRALLDAGLPAHVGASWTADVPFRETVEAIAVARAKGVLAVEMEAAALYKACKVLNFAKLLELFRNSFC